jgi:hypothetical protein
MLLSFNDRTSSALTAGPSSQKQYALIVVLYFSLGSNGRFSVNFEVSDNDNVFVKLNDVLY